MQQIARIKSLFQPGTLRPGVQRVLVNTGWLFGDRILRMLLSVFVVAWTARYLGPTDFGLLNYATAFALFLSAFSSLGLESIIVRDLVRNPDQRHELLGTAYFLKLPASILVYLVTAVAIIYLKPDDRSAQHIVWIVGLSTLFTPFEVWDFWFQSIVQAKYSIIARNVTFFISCAVRIAFILTRQPLVNFAWVIVIENATAAIGLTIVAHRTGTSIFRWKPQITRARAMLTESWPLMLSGMVIAIYMRIDQLMLEQRGSAQVGIYSAAVRVSELWYFVPTAISASVSPAIIKAREVAKDLYERRQLQLYTSLVALSYAAGIGVTLVAPILIRTLYGEKYEDAATVLSIHIWTGVLVGLGVARQTWVVAEGLTMFSLWSTGVGAAINVVLNLIWIPRYGAIGCSFATLVAEFFVVIVAPLFHPKGLRIFILQLSALVLNRGRIP